ncbi:MAG TPA: MlaD family protein [Solirubrobacterales bacterium]|nr:MlaD family protein [Solirubrobacterales bacterium]
MTPAAPKVPQRKDYDERIYRKGHPPHRTRNALILIALVIAGTYLAWTKSIPFQSQFELKAVFQNAANIRKDSPVRIAGVNVGKVESVKSVCANGLSDSCASNYSEVTFTVDDDGLPIHSDAQVEIRPRIFLEGNFFLDVSPGSPSAHDLSDGDTIPVTQTSTAVQLDQILTSLQAPDRANLQKLLEGYGQALNRKPTPADDATQDPEVQGLTAAEAINKSFTYGATAARDSAIVNEALQGTSPHDLSNLIAGQARVFNALVGHESQLQGLVSNFNTVAGALAEESTNLQRTIRQLGPTLEVAEPSLRHTDSTLPFLRANALALAKGIPELPATIAASQPWLDQTAALLGRNELGYIARQLRLAGPGAGKSAADGRGLFSQIGLLSGCVNNVLEPTGNVVLSDSGPGYNFDTGVPNFKEFGYAAVNLAGDGIIFDGNGPALRLFAGGGSTPEGGPVPNLRSPVPGAVSTRGSALWGGSTTPPIGTRPGLGSKPPFRTDVACQNNSIPDLNGPLAAQGPPDPAAYP